MFNSMIVASTAIPIFSTTEYCAISQIQPQIISFITPFTLPSSWWYLLPILQLRQIVGKPAINNQ
jgi:hypothetical protein